MKHPHFHDGGALDWHLTLKDAMAAAQASGKKIFIEYGREACGNCRDLVEDVIPRNEDVKRALTSGFVACAIDCDAPDPAVRALGAANLAGFRMLPFVIYTDAQGKFLHGTQGGRSARELLADLELVAKK
jgi:hypothetical protein